MMWDGFSNPSAARQGGRFAAADGLENPSHMTRGIQ